MARDNIESEILRVSGLPVPGREPEAPPQEYVQNDSQMGNPDQVDKEDLSQEVDLCENQEVIDLADMKDMQVGYILLAQAEGDVLYDMDPVIIDKRGRCVPQEDDLVRVQRAGNFLICIDVVTLESGIVRGTNFAWEIEKSALEFEEDEDEMTGPAFTQPLRSARMERATRRGPGFFSRVGVGLGLTSKFVAGAVLWLVILGLLGLGGLKTYEEVDKHWLLPERTQNQLEQESAPEAESEEVKTETDIMDPEDE